MLSVLLLRGPQTPGELKQRSERMAPVQSLAETERVIEQLADRGYVVSLGRRPGQKEDRFAQLLGRAPAHPPTVAPTGMQVASAGGSGPAEDRHPPTVEDLHRPAPAPAATAAQVTALEDRVAALEADLAGLREQLSDLLS